MTIQVTYRKPRKKFLEFHRNPIKVLQPTATPMVLIAIKSQYAFFIRFILRFLLKKRC